MAQKYIDLMDITLNGTTTAALLLCVKMENYLREHLKDSGIWWKNFKPYPQRKKRNIELININ